LDISPQKTHAIIAGREIFKTIRVSADGSSEEFNIRDAIIKYGSKKQVPAGLSSKIKDQLEIKDVKWSHGEFDTIIATAAGNGRVVVYDLQRAGLELSRLNGHSRQVHRLAFNPHRPAWLLSGSQDSTIRMWDLRSASTAATISSISRYNSNSDAVRDIRWSPGDGTMFATATDSGAIQCWDYRQTKAPLLKIAAHEKPCYAVDWHPDGKHIVSAGTDKQIKVWDFSSSAERRQKPTFQFRAPQPVSNVRWRPPSWNADSEDGGDWQSTQLVTTYEKDDPRIHLWDLRRPHIPFREIDRYDTAAADLLWRSKDLLWTVGEAGALTQTDIRFSPQILNRRPMCAVSWSPTGEVLAITQKRPRQRTFGVGNSELFPSHNDSERNIERVSSQSFTDGNLDDFSSFNSKSQKTPVVRPSKSLGNTPPGQDGRLTVAPLQKTLAVENPVSHQLGAIGQIAGVAPDVAIFRFLAQRYAPLMKDSRENSSFEDPITSFLGDLDRNAEQARSAGLQTVAQTWSIVKYAVVQELEFRAEEQRQKSKEITTQNRRTRSPGFYAARVGEGSKSGKMKSHLFKGVIETEGHRRRTPEIESTSNMTTPLAQPLPDSPSAALFSSASDAVSLTDDLVDIQPLPPSVMSSHYSSKNQTDLRNIPRMQRHESESSEYGIAFSSSFISEQVRDAQWDDLEGDQRSAPRAIAGRADWRRYASTDLVAKEGSEDDYEQRVENRKALLRDYKVAPKKVLNLESLANEPVSQTRPAQYIRHDSNESFPMFSASTDSSHRTKSIEIPFSPRTGGLTSFRRDSTQWETEENPIMEEEEHSPTSENKETSDDSGTLDDSSSSANKIHLERPSSPAPLMVETSQINKDAEEPFGGQEVPSRGNELVTLPLTPEMPASKPWSAQVILKEAIQHFHSSTPVDIQMAAHLLHKTQLLFDDGGSILPYDECQQIFKVYNEQLLRHSMYIEAAELRNFCVSLFPAVYEYAQNDTFINIYCFTCKKAYENPGDDNNRRCHRCQSTQNSCPICLSLEPPPEWIEPEPISDTFDNDDSEIESSISFSLDMTEPLPELEHHIYVPSQSRGSSLWSWCQGCGHGGHLVCMKKWLSDLEISEGGCPTPGCVHDCGPGPRRQEYRELTQSAAFGRKSASNIAKRDPWVTGESRAVEKVRGMLTSAPSSAGIGTGGSGSTANTSSGGGTMSPKKVRLVTPVEQGKRHSVSIPNRDRESTSDPFPG
jgi:WD40 repeat protein